MEQGKLAADGCRAIAGELDFCRFEVDLRLSVDVKEVAIFKMAGESAVVGPQTCGIDVDLETAIGKFLPIDGSVDDERFEPALVRSAWFAADEFNF